MGATPDEMRVEIERTRDRLTGDVDRIVDRTSPRQMARRRTERVRSGLRGTKERIMGLPSDGGRQMQQATETAREGVHQAVDTAKDGASQAADAVRATPRMAARQTQGNPVAAGMIAFGGGLLLASLLPTTRPERKAGRQLKEHAEELAAPMKDAAQQMAEDGRSSLRDSAEEIKDAAAQAAQTTGAAARDQAQQVRPGSGG